MVFLSADSSPRRTPIKAGLFAARRLLIGGEPDPSLRRREPMGQGRAYAKRATDRSPAPPVEPLIVLAAVMIAAAALLGGGSRAVPLRLAAVELLSLPLLAVATLRLARDEGATSVRRALWPLALLAAILAVPLLQLIPLPPALWTRLPGQAPRLEALTLAGLPIGWAPLSLAPAETERMALALAPPTAMFLAMLALGPSAGRRLTVLWLAMAVLGLALGVGQMASPEGGPAYLFAVTNQGSLVGLFANRNHEAAFLLALLPFAAALATRRRSTRPGAGVSPAPWLAGLFITLAVVALGVIRSRTGLLLAAPAVAAALLVIAADGRRGGMSAGGAWRTPALLAAAVTVALLAVATFSLTPILDRFAPAASQDLRLEAWPHVIAAARAYQPLGAGLGAFNTVYQAVEPLNLVVPTYFNHAHNEFLELWLEAGWPGVGLIAAFLAWLLVAAVAAWRWGSGLARAAAAAVLLLLAASVTDYPLRTETLAVFVEIPGWDCVTVCQHCHDNNYGRSNNPESVHYYKHWIQRGGIRNHQAAFKAWSLRIKFWVLVIIR